MSTKKGVKHNPMSMEDSIASIERALRSGHILHTFRSGGGLQVARIEKVHRSEPRGALKGYGEHPFVNEALRHAGEDFAAGGRPYAEVYGTIDWDNPEQSKEGIYPMYLTGTNEVEGEGRLVEWAKKDGNIDARSCDGKIEVTLRGWGHHELPEHIMDAVIKTGIPQTWEDDRGCQFQTSPYRFPGGQTGCTTRCLTRPDGMKEHRVWMWRTAQVGLAATFTDALNMALKALPVPTEDK